MLHHWHCAHASVSRGHTQLLGASQQGAHVHTCTNVHTTAPAGPSQTQSRNKVCVTRLLCGDDLGSFWSFSFFGDKVSRPHTCSSAPILHPLRHRPCVPGLRFRLAGDEAWDGRRRGRWRRAPRARGGAAGSSPTRVRFSAETRESRRKHHFPQFVCYRTTKLHHAQCYHARPFSLYEPRPDPLRTSSTYGPTNRARLPI